MHPSIPSRPELLVDSGWFDQIAAAAISELDKSWIEKTGWG